MVAALDPPVEMAGPSRPRIAVTMGDPSGIGPELTAKLLSNPANRERADIILLADEAELQNAIRDAGDVHVDASHAPAGPRNIQVLDDGSAPSFTSARGEVSRASGARALHQLRRALALAQAGSVDAIVFAPLNKSSLKLAGMTEEDELRWFANQLGFAGTTSEINIAGDLWTGRVTSHIPVGEVAGRVNAETTLRAIELLHRLRWESGVDAPRLGVCALNPHNGENGAFGRHELDHIGPAVAAARERGIDAQGPFPCDTIFLARRRFDGIVTMYHDQGQIAMKLLSFEGGVTVQGGLPIPVATPAHGTAFDIVGRNRAAVASTQNAFDVAVTMAERRISGGVRGRQGDAMPVKSLALPQASVVEVHSGCC